MSIGTKSKGTRIYHATDLTTWTAVVAAGTPSGSWTEVLCAISVSNPKRFEVQEHDVSCLGDAVEQPVQELKPGSFSFRSKQTTDCEAVKTLADAVTKKAWAVLYPDGRACYFASAVLIPQSEGDADNSLTSEVMHSYMVRGLVNGAWQAPG